MSLIRSSVRNMLAALAAALFISACGGGGGGGAAPPPPAPTLTSIAVTPLNPSVSLNNSQQLTATGTYSDNSTKDLTATATWSSGSTAVATVGANTGLVIPAAGAAAGQTAVITATSGTVSGTTTITLTAAATFSIATVTDPLANQQWALLNTGLNNGYADTFGVANTTGLAGSDINVDPVYSTYGYTGLGVTVAVVDSGLEIAHEDLKANVVPNGSWNFLNSTTDPTNTTATTGDHGTMVSGLIAMAKNGIGGIGVAPNAKLKGFNFLGGAAAQTLANEIAALGGSTANPNSSDVFIFNQSFGTGNAVDFPMDPTVEAQYASGTSTLRGGKGALYVKSAGNGYVGNGNFAAGNCGVSGNNNPGISCQNANFDPSNTLPYNIVMAALNAKGTRTSYSTAGSTIWASTPGGEAGFNAAAAAFLGVGFASPTVYDPAMVTTDQSGCLIGESMNPATAATGPYSYFNWGGAANVGGVNLNCNYTNGMNGTSSAAPMMSGVIALILQANPALTWREVKDILAKTAVKVDAAMAPVTMTTLTGSSVASPYVAEQGWINNAAGYNYQNSYGFGAANAKAAVDMARIYTSGSLGTFANTGWIAGTVPAAPNNIVPDNSITGVSVPVSVTKVGASGIVEAVQLQVTTTATQAASASGCLTATEGCTGDIAIELTSPSGTKSILKNTWDGFKGFFFAGMVLESNAFYGETSTGTWTAKLVDGWIGSGNQTVTAVSIRVYGH